MSATHNQPAPAQDKLDLYIDSIKHLPPAPSLMVKLLAVFKHADPDIDEVVNLVSQDPSLTTEVLRRCNSAHHAGESPIVDMFQAISRLGFYEVYRIVVLISGARTLSPSTVSSVVLVERIWRHSLATAVGAGVIAREANESESIAFTAGLLHDVGKLALASAEGARYVNLLHATELQGGSQFDAEKSAFGFDHSEVGARLLERWHLPPEVVTAVRHHHNLPESDPGMQQAAVVALADGIAYSLAGKSEDKTDPLINGAKALAILALPPEVTASLVERIQADIKRDSSP